MTLRSPQPATARPAADLSRRGFFAGLAAAATSSWCLADGPPGPAWALLADTHIDAAAATTVRGQNMADNLAGVVADVRAISPDATVINGDVAFAEGRLEDYEAFGQLAAPLLRSTSFITPGNHDHRANLLKGLHLGPLGPVAGKQVTTVVSGQTRFVFLDSLDDEMRYAGRLGPAQRRWLRHAVQPDLPSVVFVHHNPDDALIGLRDGPALREALIENRRVKAVVFGHTHRFRLWSEAGLHFVNLPATGYFFNPVHTLGWLLARWQSGGVDLEFRAVDAKAKLHGTRRRLTWRSDRQAG